MKKLNLFLNTKLLENNGEKICDVLKRLVMFSKMSLFYSVIYTITYVNTSLINSFPSNKHLVNVVYIMHVHICESISSHDVDNFMKNRLIICIMVIQIVLYTGSSCTDKLTYIFSKRTHFNEQLMLLGFEFGYIHKRVILTRHKSSIHNILITEILSICYNIILQLYHIIF